MKIKDLYKKILFYTSVPKCVCCREKLDMDDVALCKVCKVEHENIKNSYCSVCFKVLSRCHCVNEHLEKHMMHKLTKVFRYKPPANANDRIASNELIYNIKRGKRTDLLQFITDEMVDSIKNSLKYEDYLITSVPRKRSRILKYGLDHSMEIAKLIAKELGIKYVKLLKSKLTKPQKKTHGEERILNAKYDYLRKIPEIKGKRIILVDDIVTTGASMGYCTMLIRGLGAKEVVGACMAVAFKDKYKPFLKTEY